MPAQPPEHPGHIRLCPIPDPAPPFDGEAVQGRGDPPALGGEAPAAAERAPAAAERAPGGDAPGPGTRPAGARVPPWPSRFAQVLAETLAGSRPAHQLTPWTTRRARERIARLGPQLTSRQRPRVRRVVTCQPAPGVLEMAIVVGTGGRVRAVAVRLESAPGRGWTCTAVEAA